MSTYINGLDINPSNVSPAFHPDTLSTADIGMLRTRALRREDHVAIEICDEAMRGMADQIPGYRSWSTINAMSYVCLLLNCWFVEEDRQ